MTENPMRVCAHCLAAIESREGAQYARPVYLDDEDAADFFCDWCGSDIYETLYEI